ncbi:MAG: hypothetical protein JRI61_04120 [Deltaproteobacteria bacterium]|nr:hypothetical protein [Deltaproteobacteria bacterium]
MVAKTAKKIFEEISADLEKLKSVEFFIDELNRIYQFKVWGNTLTSMFVLVREDSEIVDRIGVGEVYEMKYYSFDESQPVKNFNTKIKYFDKIDQGRFKGHYLTGLAVVQ